MPAGMARLGCVAHLLALRTGLGFVWAVVCGLRRRSHMRDCNVWSCRVVGRISGRFFGSPALAVGVEASLCLAV